jgi:hypothetical protein
MTRNIFQSPSASRGRFRVNPSFAARCFPLSSWTCFDTCSSSSMNLLWNNQNTYKLIFCVDASFSINLIPKIIWNPVSLDRIGQKGTYWYVPVRTGTTRYKAVREFHGRTYRYVPVHTVRTFNKTSCFLTHSERVRRDKIKVVQLLWWDTM